MDPEANWSKRLLSHHLSSPSQPVAKWPLLSQEQPLPMRLPHLEPRKQSLPIPELSFPPLPPPTFAGIEVVEDKFSPVQSEVSLRMFLMMRGAGIGGGVPALGNHNQRFIPSLSHCVSSQPFTTPRQQPRSLDAAMTYPANQEKIYMSFCELLQGFLTPVEVLMDNLVEVIPSALKWLTKTYPTYSMKVREIANSENGLYVRVLIFWTLRRLQKEVSNLSPQPPTIERIQRSISRCFDLEPPLDLIHTMTVDVSGWLIHFDGKLTVRDSGRQLRLSENELRAAQDDAMVDAFGAAVLALLEGPFEIPDMAICDRVSNLLRETSTRSDTYALLLDLLRRLSDRLCALTIMHSARTPGSEDAHISRIQSALTTLRTRASWIGTFLSAHTSLAVSLPLTWNTEQFFASSPNQTIGSAGNDICDHIVAVAGVESAGVIEVAKALRDSFKRSMDELVCESISEDLSASDEIPPWASLERHKPYLVALLNSKRDAEKQTSVVVDEDENEDEDHVYESISSMSSTESEAPEKEDTFANVNHVWLQVDPSVTRIMVATASPQSEEVLTSAAPGTLTITRTELIWSGIDQVLFQTKGSSTRPETAVRLRHAAIARYTTGVLKGEESGMQFSPRVSEVVAPSRLASSVASRRVSAFTALASPPETRAGGGGLAGMGAQKGAGSQFVAVYTADEVFRFFPFNAREAVNVVRILNAVTGLGPFTEAADRDDGVPSLFDLPPPSSVRHSQVRKLEASRRRALDRLSEEKNPWIEESSELARTLEALTAEHAPQRIMDMERLFHSCRNEIEVTKETVLGLRVGSPANRSKIWFTTQSTQVKLKVLSVMDRILDKSVMRQGDSTFTATIRWLKGLEDTVSPYKNPEALKLIISLVRRAKRIQVEPMTPLERAHCPGLFDHWKDQEFLARFYEWRPDGGAGPWGGPTHHA
ncbi:hypothetical protein BDK51DRAFT_42346 [Blyttiomyces helicus]|uniref:Uncharacterized protein n=1 Tax=Blyttiomyces helicus TaxID=388810 RepID=A0A4P9W8B6_9FUNG|nr:hypothetical protein BDK51DRAFT_42346 [Blyttiomyces helicus]|eukprot:RKO87693.1 hypothetical protein BDK51DRAFT_42346 [Blyttiomyces helicus]